MAKDRISRDTAFCHQSWLNWWQTTVSFFSNSCKYYHIAPTIKLHPSTIAPLICLSNNKSHKQITFDLLKRQPQTYKKLFFWKMVSVEIRFFAIKQQIGQCIHSYWLLCKSMGSAMVIHIFNLISKTTIQIHFKLGVDMPWMGLYQVCSNGHGPVIFGFFMNSFVHFWGKS